MTRSPRRVRFPRQCFSCLGTTASAIRCRAHVSTGSRHARYVERCLVKRRQQQCNTASAPACARRCRQELGAQRRAEKEASGSQPGARRRCSPSLRTVQSAFNWAHSGVRSPATRRAGGGARGSGVGSSSTGSTALALLLSDAAVRVSPRSTIPGRWRVEQRDGTRALEIEGARTRGQAGAYQSGSRLSLRRRSGSVAGGMND